MGGAVEVGVDGGVGDGGGGWGGEGIGKEQMQ